MDDADREPEVLDVGGGLQDLVTRAQVLVAHALETEVGMGGAQLRGPGEGDLAEVAEGEREEGRIDLGAAHGRNLHAA